MPVFDLQLKRGLARDRDMVAVAKAITASSGSRWPRLRQPFQPSARIKSRWPAPNITRWL